MNAIELTLEEYNAIIESRNKIAYDIYIEALENYVDDEDIYNEGISYAAKSDFKKFKYQFKIESKKLNRSLKNDNKEDAKISCKKMRSILNDIRNKVESEPDEDCMDILSSIAKAIGTYIITAIVAGVTGAAIIGHIDKNDINRVSNKPLNNLVKTVNSTKKVANHVYTGTKIAVISGIVLSIKSIIGDIIGSKKSILIAIDMYDKQLSKIENKL